MAGKEIMMITLRRLDDEIPGALINNFDYANNSDGYVYLSDLIRDFDDRELFDEEGRLPSEADREYYLVDKGNGVFLLYQDVWGEPKFILMTSEAFHSRFPETLWVFREE